MKLRRSPSITLAIVLAGTAMYGQKSMSRQTMPGITAQSKPARMQAPGWTLNQIEALARRRNPTLRQVRAYELAAAGKLRQAGLWPNPSVGYEGDQIRGGSFGGGEQGVFARQTIELGGKLAAARQVARAGVRRAAVADAAQVQAVAAAVRLGFYHALLRQREIAMARALAANAAAAYRTTLQLANVGQADRADELQARIAAGQARLRLAQARARARAAWRELAAVTGDAELRPGPLRGHLRPRRSLPRRPAYLATLLRRAPAVRLAQTGLARAAARLTQAGRQSIPNLSLRGGIQTNRELISPHGPVVGWQEFASAGIGLPLWNRNQGNRAAARAELTAAREELTRVRLLLRRRAARVWARYRAAQLAVRQYARLLPLARQAYQLLRHDYRNMAAAYPQVLMAQRSWYELEMKNLRQTARLRDYAVRLESQMNFRGLHTTRPQPTPVMENPPYVQP